MDSLWNNLDKVTMIRLIAQWTVAISGIVALIFTMRSTTLKNDIDASRAKAELDNRILLENKIQTANAELGQTKKELEKLRPKPLKTRILDFLKRLDSQILLAAEKGQRNFGGTLTTAQLAELQSLCNEDKNSHFIAYIHSTNLIIPGPGLHGDIRFMITDELLQ